MILPYSYFMSMQAVHFVQGVKRSVAGQSSCQKLDH
jgi:hypothetical protein